MCTVPEALCTSLNFCLPSHALHTTQVAKLARAEQAVEKYQKKLEEMLELKKQNKDLCDKMDQYLDQIHSLESANKVGVCLCMFCAVLCVCCVYVVNTRCTYGPVPVPYTYLHCQFTHHTYCHTIPQLLDAIGLLSFTLSFLCVNIAYFVHSSAQGMSTLNKMVEQYKNKAVELETEKFEALSSVQMRDQQVSVCVLYFHCIC